MKERNVYSAQMYLLNEQQFVILKVICDYVAIRQTEH